MAYEINMTVKEKKTIYAGIQSVMICDNADYELVLELDEEWDSYETVTVLFKLPGHQGTIGTLCTGRRCPVPLVQVPGMLRIGVTAGTELHTTRWMEINVLPSIRTIAGREAAEIPPDLAQQIIERLDELEKGGGSGGGTGGTSFKPGNALELVGGVLGVTTADTAEPGNTLPITSAAVYDIAAAQNREIADKLDADKLPETINTALAQAKESGEFDGDPGISPHVGGNGNWFVGNTDTGVQAQGDDYVLKAQDKAEIAQMAVGLLPRYNGEVEDV